MASIHKDINLGADVAAAWAAVRDFGAVHERVAVGFVTNAELDGDVRTVWFANGAVAKELLVDIDDERRRLVYSVIDSSLGLTHHQATVQVTDSGNGAAGSRFAWTTDVLPADAAPTIEAMMTAGAQAIAHTLAR